MQVHSICRVLRLSVCKDELPEAVGISHLSVIGSLRRACDESVNVHLPERLANRVDPLAHSSANLGGNYLQREARVSTRLVFVSHAE